MKQKRHFYKSWVEISKSALLHNLDSFKELVGENTTVLCVVKANAYGHGLKEVVTILKDHLWFGVDSVSEALLIKKLSPKASVLILGYVPATELKIIIEKDISFIVYNIETLEEIKKLQLKKQAKIHLKIETGLNRQGVSVDQLIKLLEFIKEASDFMILEGISTHFADIRDSDKSDFMRGQLVQFEKAIQVIKAHGFKPSFIHCAATGAISLYSEAHFNMVRLGIGLYGLYPSTEIAKKMERKIDPLRPVLTWKSIVAEVKNINPGESVGYGRTWIAKKKTKIAIVPVGYADGYDRKLSNNSSVLIHDQTVPVIGRISMNMLAIDVTDIPNVNLEDEVILIGESVSVNEIAQKIGTINHEVLSRINPNIPRVVTP